tara:strand:+ start:17155 stop:17700 length:546 start_codon:yes stop_codon:yes gene_type:complete
VIKDLKVMIALHVYLDFTKTASERWHAVNVHSTPFKATLAVSLAKRVGKTKKPLLGRLNVPAKPDTSASTEFARQFASSTARATVKPRFANAILAISSTTIRARIHVTQERSKPITEMRRARRVWKANTNRTQLPRRALPAWTTLLAAKAVTALPTASVYQSIILSVAPVQAVPRGITKTG